MADLLDAEAAYADGTLRALTKGLVQRFIREARPSDILPLVAEPIARLATALRSMGQPGLADGVLAHAVHDGVAPSTLALAITRNATPPALVLGDPTDVVTVAATGAISIGAPPPATDAASAAALANYLQARIDG